MLITKVSLITKKINTLDIPISNEEYDNFINNSDIETVKVDINAGI